MKTIYKVLYPMGYEEHQVEDNFPTSLPFVEVPPILFEKKEDETDEGLGRRQQSQFLTSLKISGKKLLRKIIRKIGTTRKPFSGSSIR